MGFGMNTHQQQEIEQNPGENRREQIVATHKQEAGSQHRQMHTQCNVQSLMTHCLLIGVDVAHINKNAQPAQQQQQPGNIPIPAIAQPFQIGTRLQERFPGKAKNRHNLLKAQLQPEPTRNRDYNQGNASQLRWATDAATYRHQHRCANCQHHNGTEWRKNETSNRIHGKEYSISRGSGE